MAEGTMRGTRLGSTTFETDEHVVPVERIFTDYDCPNGHHIVVPFAADADAIPQQWECRCGGVATLREGSAPEMAREVEKEQRPLKTHWDMLIERRSRKELEDLLQERLALLRGTSMTKQTA